MSGAEPFLIAAGAAFSAMGAIQAGNAEAAAAKRQAQIDERNKRLADQDRQLAVRTSQIAAEDQSRSNRRRLADLRANLGNSGIELAGSPLDVLADTSIEMALDTRRTGYEGEVRNREGGIEMLNYAESADANRRRAKNAKKAGRTSAGAALLSGATSAYGSFDEHGYFD